MEAQFEVVFDRRREKKSRKSHWIEAVLERCDHGPITVELGRLGVARSPRRL
jgi:hypothetical protein